MSNSILDITREHGKEMRRLALEHALEMAKIYRDFDTKPIDRLITHLEDKLAAEADHNRFDEDHHRICEDCYSGYADFMQEQADDARLDAMSEQEG